MANNRETPIQAEYDAANGWVSASVQGALSIDITLEAFKRARTVAEQHDCKTILLDLSRIRSVTSFIDSYMFAKNFRDTTGIDNSYRLAVVYDPAHYPSSRADTLQMVGRNWGNMAGRMFTNLDEAIEFLRQDSTASGEPSGPAGRE